MKYLTTFIIACQMITLPLYSGEGDSGALTDSSTTDRLFVSYKVWNIHLGFTVENWEAMNPEKNFKPQNEGGEGGAFGPGGFIAPAIIEQGDVDGNGQLTEEEFAGLGKKWYNSWDEDGENRVDADEIDQGFSEVFDEVSGSKIPLQGAEGERNGIASVLGIEYPETMADVEFEDQTINSAAIRYKGNGTYLNAMGTNKLPFKIDLNDGYPGRNLAGVVKINLHNNITDPSYMNEVLAHQLFRDAGIPAPRTTYTRVHVTVPGQFDREYFGLYSVVENVDKQFIADRFGTRKGAILKPVTPFLFRDLGDQWDDYKQIYDPKTNLSDAEKWRLIDLCRLVTHASDYEFAERIGEFFELDDVARYLAATVLISDLDGILGPGQNFYLYLHPKKNKFIFIPWDQDHSFGQFGRTQEQREQLSLQKPWDGRNRFLERLYQMDTFKESYLSHMTHMNDTLFTEERINAQIDQLASVIRPAVQEDSPEKLELFNRLISWDSHHNENNIPLFDPKARNGAFGSAKDVKPIRGFVVARTTSVEDQLAGRSNGLEDVLPGEEPHVPFQGFFSSIIMGSMDTDQDGQLTAEEIDLGFALWYDSWSNDGAKILTEKEVKTGLSRSVASMRGN